MMMSRQQKNHEDEDELLLVSAAQDQEHSFRKRALYSVLASVLLVSALVLLEGGVFGQSNSRSKNIVLQREDRNLLFCHHKEQDEVPDPIPTPTAAPTAAPTASPTIAPTPAPKIDFVDWSSASSGTFCDGTTVSFTVFGGSIAAYDLTGEDFDAAPGSANTDTVIFFAREDWTITFDEEISGLYLYCAFWRGSGASNPVYTFDQEFSVTSGLSSAVSTSSPVLQLPESGFPSGTLYFEGPLTNLTMTAATTVAQKHALTFSALRYCP